MKTPIDLNALTEAFSRRVCAFPFMSCNEATGITDVLSAAIQDVLPESDTDLRRRCQTLLTLLKGRADVDTGAALDSLALKLTPYVMRARQGSLVFNSAGFEFRTTADEHVRVSLTGAFITSVNVTRP